MAGFETLNASFHDAYDRAQERGRYLAPVLLVRVEELVIIRDRAVTSASLDSRAFHIIKSAAHAPIALFAALVDREDGPLADEAVATLTVALGALRLPDTERAGLDAEARHDVEHVLRVTKGELEARLDSGLMSSAALQHFAAAVRPYLLRLTEHATRIRLTRLHDAVERELAGWSAEERRDFDVVVTGDLQARARSVDVQYFRQRLGNGPGAESRVTYADAVEGAVGACTLVRKQRLDRGIASAFFGDERKLQQDVLGDAAAKLLTATPYSRIAG